MARHKYSLHGEDISWVVDQIVKTFYTLNLHLTAKKRPFPTEYQLTRILNDAKERIKKEYYDK